MKDNQLRGNVLQTFIKQLKNRIYTRRIIMVHGHVYPNLDGSIGFCST